MLSLSRENSLPSDAPQLPAHLILDLDGTLISDSAARPHLATFLSYCFARFASVSIWTAASPDWWRHANAQYLRPLGLPFEFARVLTEQHCQIETNPSYPDGRDPYLFYKPLSLLWEDPENPLEPNNTLILDDTPHTASRNPENLVRISRYVSGDTDTGLIDIVPELELRLSRLQFYGDIRHDGN